MSGRPLSLGEETQLQSESSRSSRWVECDARDMQRVLLIFACGVGRAELAEAVFWDGF